MAPIKNNASSNPNPPWVLTILNELALLRAEVVSTRQLVNQIDNRLQTQSIPSIPNANRQSLRHHSNNQPLPQPICWYHRQFGPATNNCIPPCTFSGYVFRSITQPLSAPSYPVTPDIVMASSSHAVVASNVSTKKIKKSVPVDNKPPTPNVPNNLSDSSSEDETSWRKSIKKESESSDEDNYNKQNFYPNLSLKGE